MKTESLSETQSSPYGSDNTPFLNLPRQLRFRFSLLLVVTTWQTIVLGTPVAAERPNVILIMTDGTFEPATALPIAWGRIRIGSYEATAGPDETQTAIRFSADLVPGPIELQTWMLDESEQEICGAYYVPVRRES